MNENEYWTMKEIATLFGGESSHTIGKKLKELGLRTKDGKPSGSAFRGGYCSQRWTDLNENYCWAWHKDKTLAKLIESGMTLLASEQG